MNVQLRPRVRALERRLPFECVALVLQGGGALGAYQGGVYEALAEANIHPDWIAGISIGAINAPSLPATLPMTASTVCESFGRTLLRTRLGMGLGIPSGIRRAAMIYAICSIK